MKALFKTLLLAVLVFGFSTAVNAQESKTKKEKYQNSQVEQAIEEGTASQQEIRNYEKQPVNAPVHRVNEDEAASKNASSMRKGNNAVNKEEYYAKREKLIQDDKRQGGLLGTPDAELSDNVSSKHPNAISPAEAKKWILENESKGTKGNTEATDE